MTTSKDTGLRMNIREREMEEVRLINSRGLPKWP